MKKTFGVLISLVVILSMVGTVFAASAPPGTGWYTGITFQNIGTGTANVSVTAYGAGTTTATASLTIPQNQSKSILPTDFTGMDAGFQGGAIASSDQELRSIVNVTNRPVSGLGDTATPHAAAAQYQGMSTTNTTLLFPLAKNNNFGKSTTFYVQNAGSAAATATADFVFAGTHYTFTTPSLNPGQTAVFGPMDAKNGTATPPSGNIAGSVGALTVTSTQLLAGVFLEHKTTEAHATLLQSTRAFIPSDADSVLYVPTNKDNYFNRFTGVQVQNVGPGNVDLKITYTNTSDTSSGCTAPGTVATDTTAGLAAGTSWTFPSSAMAGDKCLAAAKVEVTAGTGKIVGVVNESFTSAFITANPTRFQESTTYYAFPANSVTGTKKVSIPVYKEDSFNKGTGVTIQNVNAGAATVTLTLTSSAGTFVSAPITIAGGGSQSFSDLRNKAASFWKTATTPMTPAALGCTSGANVCGTGGAMAMIITSDVPVVAVANESTYPFSAPRIQQDKNNYEGFNLP